VFFCPPFVVREEPKALAYTTPALLSLNWALAAKLAVIYNFTHATKRSAVEIEFF
jgi:hypothetical protein